MDSPLTTRRIGLSPLAAAAAPPVASSTELSSKCASRRYRPSASVPTLARPSMPTLLMRVVVASLPATEMGTWEPTETLAPSASA